MSKLIINRSNEIYYLTREYRIYLDGQKIETLSSGESKELDIPEGIHNLCAKIDWCGSQNLSINIINGETKTVLISADKLIIIVRRLTGLITLFLIIFREYIRNHFFLKFPLIIIASFLIIVSLYYVTIGRKKYLEIKEISKQTE